MTNYYEVLGVKQDASLDDIKKAYRALQKKYHPDVYKGDNPDYAAEMVKRANEAYDVLSDETKRAQYDQQLQYGTYTGQGYSDPYRQSYGNPFEQGYANPFGQRTYYYTRYRSTDDADQYGEYDPFTGQYRQPGEEQGDQNQPPFGFHYMQPAGCLRTAVIMGLVWLGLSLLGIRFIGLPFLFFFF